MSEKQWTFLSNHGHVFIYLSRNPSATLREIAQAVGITERSTQGIVSELETAGYIKIERNGRRNNYSVIKRAKFRHPAESDRSVDALLEIFRS